MTQYICRPCNRKFIKATLSSQASLGSKPPPRYVIARVNFCGGGTCKIGAQTLRKVVRGACSKITGKECPQSRSGTLYTTVITFWRAGPPTLRPSVLLLMLHSLPSRRLSSAHAPILPPPALMPLICSLLRRLRQPSHPCPPGKLLAMTVSRMSISNLMAPVCLPSSSVQCYFTVRLYSGLFPARSYYPNP